MGFALIRLVVVVALLAANHLFASAAGQAPVTGGEHDPGDAGPAKDAFLNFPESVALDSDGNLYISERGGNRVRKIDRRTWIITTLAGTGEKGFAGDGGPATRAKLNEPTGLASDGRGNVYIGDTWNYRIRRVDARTGIIATIALRSSPPPNRFGEWPCRRLRRHWPLGLWL